LAPFSLEGIDIVFRVDASWRWIGVSLSASTTASLSGVEQRSIDAGRVMIYRCREEELFGIMVALAVGWTRSVR
jgi:hypothetical protein